MSEMDPSRLPGIKPGEQKPNIDTEVRLPVERVSGETQKRMDSQGLGSLSNISSKADQVKKLSEMAISFRVCRDMEKREKARKKMKKEIENT